MDLLNKILPAAKAWAALVGSILATVLATMTPDDPIYTVLALAAAIATAIATYVIPNVPNVKGFEPDEFGDEGVIEHEYLPESVEPASVESTGDNPPRAPGSGGWPLSG